MIYFLSLGWTILSSFILWLVRVLLVPIFNIPATLFTIDVCKNFKPSTSEEKINETWKANND